MYVMGLGMITVYGIKASCGQCAYWSSMNADVGQCRVQPPGVVELWPVTFLDSWCGQFTPDADVQAAAINAGKKTMVAK